MNTNKVRLRTVYEPLTTACQIYCSGSNGSAFTQTYDVTEHEFIPDRSLSPLVINVEIITSSADGSWEKKGYNASGVKVNTWTDSSGKTHTVNGNCFLTDVKWYVDDVDISTSSKWTSSDYTVDKTSSSLRFTTDSTSSYLRSDTYGQLTIKKNCDAGTKYRIRLEGKIVDSRLGINIPVVSNECYIQTIARIGDELSINMDKGNIMYSIFQDRLLEYDYETAMELTHNLTREQAIATGTPYLQELPYTVYLGKEIYLDESEPTHKITPTLYRKGTNGFEEVDLESEDDEVVEITSEYIKLDMRLVHGTEFYRLQVVTEDGNHSAIVEFNATRYSEHYEVQLTNCGDITTATTRKDQVIVFAGGRKLPYPECQFHIQWMTDSYNATAVKHNVGEVGIIDMAKANVATVETNAWLDVYVDIEMRGQAATYTDSNGKIYTNEHYYPFIS